MPQFPLAVRNCGFGVAVSLMMRSLPYALMRFVVLAAYSLATLAWLIVMVVGAIWSGTHIATAFGFVWFFAFLAIGGGLWAMLLRYALHLIECGHVAVLTELITRGSIGNGSESMFTYGKRIVTERFGEVNALFALNLLVRGVVNVVNRVIEGVTSLIPIPGLSTLASFIAAVFRAATRYLDKAVFAYNLTRPDVNPWSGARDGLIYYAQNAKPILKQAVWIVVLDFVLSVVLWLVLLALAVAVTLALPPTMREVGGAIGAVLAILLALAVRGAFLKPLFLIMIVTRFLTLIEAQEVNQQWVERLNQMSGKFRDLGNKAAAFTSEKTPTPDAPTA